MRGFDSLSSDCFAPQGRALTYSNPRLMALSSRSLDSMVFTNFLKKKRRSVRSRTSSGTTAGRVDDHSSQSFQNQLHVISGSDGSSHKEGMPSSTWRGRGSSPIVVSQPPPAPLNARIPSYDAIPAYVQDLAGSRPPGGERVSRALRKLFAISQVATDPEHRRELAPRLVEGDLIPALLAFLGRCDKASNEQYTALLVLNNLSIPEENKRAVAIDFNGAKILSRMLVEDPSCHLVAIVLVNLTFADPDLRSALVSQENDIHLIESLSFALRVASLTHEEYEHRRHALVHGDPEHRTAPDERLAALLAEDMRLRSILERNGAATSDLGVPSPSLQLFPETARWCLAALKNLSRPSDDTTAPCTLIRVGIIPHILQHLAIDPRSDSDTENIHKLPTPLVRLGQSTGRSESNSLRNKSSFGSSRSRQSSGARESSSCDSDSNETPVPADPEASQLEPQNRKSPEEWDDKSAQDAALFTILNLSATPLAREYLREIDAVHCLFAITTSGRTKSKLGRKDSAGEELLEFQRLKSRLALSFLVGSDSHVVRPVQQGIGNKVFYASRDDLALMVGDKEVTGMVELLANTVHRRSKVGAGGYSAATFCLRCVLAALRRLLASYENQVKIATAHGGRINALLLKAIAAHSLDSESHIDAEAAECACYSLYLLSSHGFEDEPFLPSCFGKKGTDCLTAKVLNAFVNTKGATPAGKHAASQLQLRLKYLVFDGEPADLAASAGFASCATDYSFGPSLVAECNRVLATHSTVGARPDENIFDRPILRRRIPRYISNSEQTIDWNDNEAVDFFPNALHAVGDFSFNSNEVRHLDAIDDILIANNIAHSANGEKTESYNYMWSWQDTAGEIQRHLEQQQSSESFLTFGRQNYGWRFGSMNVMNAFCGS